MRITERRAAAVWSVLLALVLAVPASAQSTRDREKVAAQNELQAAESALSAAEAAGAATFASVLYNEALQRIREARTNWSSNREQERRVAGVRAIEARHAAAAAEAQALLVATNTELRNLSADIGTFGGSAAAIQIYDPPGAISRGTTSRDRLMVAESAIRTARSVGGAAVAPQDLARAEELLGTVRRIVKNQRQSDNADHLSYVAEMLARRAEFIARRNVVAPRVTDLRAERTRLAQVAADNRAREERERRLAAEQEAARLRAQLDAESRNREANQAELERLRNQVTATETALRARLEEDRAARIAAEQQLDDVMRRYEAALAQTGASNVEIDQLRRQVEDQSLALRSIQERERASETTVGNQISTLEQALARERAEGRLTAETLAQREAELQRQRDELARLQREREESDKRREEAERARAAAIAEAERRRSEAEAQSARLRAELEQANAEIARRDTATRDRITSMQEELARLAETRTTERGLIVTLPGLFFDSGKAVLKPGARNTLTRIAEQLVSGGEMAITLEGHTDSVGSDELNQSLSERRATAVRDYLVNRGVPAGRITVVGRGESTPIATNDTPAGRQQNRRVELIIATTNAQ